MQVLCEIPAAALGNPQGQGWARFEEGNLSCLCPGLPGSGGELPILGGMEGETHSLGLQLHRRASKHQEVSALDPDSAHSSDSGTQSDLGTQLPGGLWQGEGAGWWWWLVGGAHAEGHSCRPFPRSHLHVCCLQKPQWGVPDTHSQPGGAKGHRGGSHLLVRTCSALSREAVGLGRVPGTGAGETGRVGLFSPKRWSQGDFP